MKDIKSYIIGFLSCACLFLFMGNTSSSDGQGKYQAFADNDEKYIIDTETGQLWKKHARGFDGSKGFWIEGIKPNQFYKTLKEWKKKDK